MISFERKSWSTRLAAATVFGAMLVAAPTVGIAKQPRQAAVKSSARPGDDVEARIKTLHSQLRITREQEQAWNDVAQTMRDNAKARAEAHGDQATSERTETAPDMINAYAKTMDTHAENVHRFAGVFQKLYDGMSDQQKKTADAVFREKVHNAAARHKS